MPHSIRERIRLMVVLVSLPALLLLVPFVQAAEVKLGVKGRISAIDPHFDNLAGNLSLSRHLFDTLVRMDEAQRLRPGLAEAWRIVDDSVWEFKLRRGVRFHDGGPFTADDIFFSINRISGLPNSPGGFAAYTRRIASMEKVDAHTIRFKTDGPYPLLPYDLARVAILSARAADGKTTAQLNAGEGAVGTGPYRYLSWEPGKQAVLERNEVYWGDDPEWERVIVRSVPSDEARVEALTKGEVDLIDAVPPSLQKGFRKRRKFTLVRGVSNRVICLFLDSRRNRSPFVTGTRSKNPLKNVRVRQAISLALDRERIAKKVLAGNGVPARQFVAEGVIGHLSALKAEKPSLRTAKRLMARAGYRRGFGLTLHAPGDRYLQEMALAGAVAAALKKIGIRAKLEVKPPNIFFPLAARREFSLLLAGWSLEGGEASAALRDLLATPTPAGEMGARNFGGYSNRRLDTLLAAAMKSMDQGRRESLLREATEIAIKDYAVIPLFFERNTWAVRKGLRFTPRADGATLAMNLSSGG